MDESLFRALTVPRPARANERQPCRIGSTNGSGMRGSTRPGRLPRRPFPAARSRWAVSGSSLPMPCAKGDRLTLTLGQQTLDIDVLAIPVRRGPASEAQACYAQTPESLRRNTVLREQHRLAALSRPRPDTRPDKRERRQLDKLRRKQTRGDRCTIGIYSASFLVHQRCRGITCAARFLVHFPR